MTWFIVWSSLLFVLGLLLGAWWGVGYGERITVRALEERAEERRAARWLDRVRETRGGTVMPYRPPELHHERRTSTASFLAPKEEAIALASRFLDPQVAHEAWLAHEEQALALARPESDEEFTARMAGWADEIIAAARLAPDPYDQLWSAQ